MTRVDDIVVVVQDARRLVYGWTDIHMAKGQVVKHQNAALLDQLRAKADSVAPGDDGGNAAGKPVVSKMPIAQEACLSMAIEIETELARVAIFIGASAQSREPMDNYDFVCRQIDYWDDVTVRMIADHFEDILARAETELEIRPRPKVLRARCPQCQSFGHIHIGIDKDGRATDAVCKSCAARWSRYQLGHLASLMNGEDSAQEA